MRLWRKAGGGYDLVFEAAGLSGPVGALEFARDADRLLVQVTGEHTARVWDLGVLRGQLAGVNLGW